MNSLDFFESLGSLEPSLGLNYRLLKMYWKQLLSGYTWYMKARPGKFTDEKDRDDRWWSRYEKQVENA